MSSNSVHSAVLKGAIYGSIIGSILTASISSLIVQAGSSDGVFGTYFQNIVNNASLCGTSYAITGFNSSDTADYGKQKCTTFQDIVKSVLGTHTQSNNEAVVGFGTDGAPKYSSNVGPWGKNVYGVYYTGSNVGIGTNSPAVKLDLAGKIRSTESIVSGGSSEGGQIILGYTGTSPTGQINSTWNIDVDGSNNFRIFRRNSAGVSSIPLQIQETTGNVGIGTNSPSEKLDVNGYIRVRSTNGEGGTIQLDGNNGTKVFAENNKGTFRIINNAWNKELFTIDQNGNAGIGTSPWNGLGWPGSLNVDGSIRGARYYDDDTNYYVDANSTSKMNVVDTKKVCISGDCKTSWPSGGGITSACGVIGKAKPYTDPSSNILASNCSGGYAVCGADGKLSYIPTWSSNSAWCDTSIADSDRRLKKDIVSLTGSLQKIMQLNGYAFTWKEDDTKDIGVIAQEVEQQFPELVTSGSVEGMKAVKYGNLVAPVIESIKEQQREIEKQSQDIQKLKQYNYYMFIGMIALIVILSIILLSNPGFKKLHLFR